MQYFLGKKNNGFLLIEETENKYTSREPRKLQGTCAGRKAGVVTSTSPAKVAANKWNRLTAK